ncbi:MAG: AAA family ATPase [Bifidobacteriaceae bacterium]|nr:AAA family ATPase [Bifidobacteriaceae bacterium]
MRLLKFALHGIHLFANDEVAMDLYASDRVPANAAFVHRDNDLGPSIYTQQLLGIAGLNASGKTTTLRVVDLVLDAVRGMPLDAGSVVYGPLYPILDTSFTIQAIIADAGNCYLIESTIGKTDVDTAPQGDASGAFAFECERLWRHEPHVVKKDLASFDAFRTNSTLISERGTNGPRELPAESKRFLAANTSLLAGELQSKTNVYRYVDAFRLPFITPAMPPAVVRTFDSNVEHLDIDDHGKVHIKLANESDERVMGQFDAAQMLSRGTVRGGQIVNFAIRALQQGGYLVVDEIENSLNKKLVETIMDLFAYPATNPHGATLVFTTHYPELLDHLGRKDDVYFTVRDDDWRIRLIKYSDQIKRIEPKKSEVFFANLVRGTAPKAKDVAALKRYVKARVERPTSASSKKSAPGTRPTDGAYAQ